MNLPIQPRTSRACLVIFFYMDKVEVIFKAKQAKYAVTETPIMVPVKIKRAGLSEIINHLLKLGESF